MKTLILVLSVLLSGCGKAVPPRIIAYGDSHTMGISGLDGKPGYVAQMGAALSLPVDNRAYGGSRISTKGQKPSVLEDALTEENPNSVIVYLVGFNDMRWGRDAGFAGFKKDLGEIFESLSRRGVSANRVLIGNCMTMRQEMYSDPEASPAGKEFNYGSDAAVDEMNSVILELVKKYAFTFLDAKSAINPYLDTGPDKLHLSISGHEKLSALFLEAIHVH